MKQMMPSCRLLLEPSERLEMAILLTFFHKSVTSRVIALDALGFLTCQRWEACSAELRAEENLSKKPQIPKKAAQLELEISETALLQRPF